MPKQQLFALVPSIKAWPNDKRSE